MTIKKSKARHLNISALHWTLCNAQIGWNDPRMITNSNRIELSTEEHKLIHDSWRNGWVTAHIDDLSYINTQTVWCTAGRNTNHTVIICHLCRAFSNLHHKLFYDCVSDFWMWLFFIVCHITYTITSRKVIKSCEKCQ